MATTPNVIKDLGTATKVPAKILDSLVDKLNLCIGSSIHDAVLTGETATVLDIGIGTLSVDLTSMQCKFMPSKGLKTAIKQALDAKIDPFELELEQEFINKLLAVCSEEI